MAQSQFLLCEYFSIIGRIVMITKQLRIAILQSHLTFRELERALKLPAGTISRFTSGDRSVSLQVADRIAEKLKLELTHADKDARH